VDIFEVAEEPRYEQFTFFLPVPGFVPDHANVDFHALYAASEVRDVDTDGLRTLLETLPCCSTDRTTGSRGRPVNVFFVGDGLDLLRALLRAGWSETADSREAGVQDQVDHYFGRVPDATLRKGRDRTTERIELNLWLAPVRVDGKPLWAGQVRHAIGRLFGIGERLFGVNLDPDTVEGRNYVLQDLWYAQALRHWAWSDSGIRVPTDAPVVDFRGAPWFSIDEFRVVIWISGEPVALSQASPFDWADVTKPLGTQP
jgi:hypothetical protein